MTIVIPILIGTFVGALTYAVGMLIGIGIVMLVSKIRGRSPYQSLAQDEEEGDVDAKGDDKEIYAELPEYDGETPPVYEEAAEKEVVDESH